MNRAGGPAIARLTAFGLAAILACAGPSRADDPPRRIVSLNQCTDELLLRLADRDQVASVTWLSRNPRGSNVAREAAGIATNQGLAEEVLRLKPDLVVAGLYTARGAVSMLRRTGMRVVEFGAPRSLAEAETQIRDFAATIGHQERGEALAGAMKARLARIEPDPQGIRPGAFVLQPNGFTAARGSLVDDVLTRAGLTNLAARLDLGNYSQVALETVILEHADILIVDTEPDSPPSLATAILAHPAVLKLGRRLAIVSIPSRLWTCAGPGLVEAVELLARARRSRLPDGRS